MDSGPSLEQEIVAKFLVKNKPMYVKTLWKPDDKNLFHIKVFYEDNSWTGKYSNELAAERRERLEETEEEYDKNVNSCLSGNSEEYICDFTRNIEHSNLANFTWKKKYEGALVTQGIVSLTQDEVATSKDTLLDILLKKNNNLILKVELAKETNNDLKQDLEQYICRLKELTESKILLESTLYGRFVQVLNEKKRRIQLLEEHLKNDRPPQ